MNDETNVVDIEETEVPEVSEMDIAIRAAFDDNVDEDEEIVKMAMLQAGCKIKAVSRLYNTFMIDSGQMASKEEKDDALDAALTDLDLSDEDTFNEAVETLVVNITGASEKSAAAMARAWAKRNEVECYTKPKGAPRGESFIDKLGDALVENPEMTDKECEAYVRENGTENTIRSLGHYQKFRSAMNRLHVKLTTAEAA